MQILKGIKVLDFSRALAGPYCTMMLADMGAEVIKIEMPDIGDDSRRWGPPFIKGESAYFLSINRNKKSMTLNLKAKRAQDIILRLLPKFDVLVENFRPGTMERLGFGYKDIHKINSRIIYCSISGFGQDGPYRLMPGFDQVIQGMGGLMSITGEPGRPPVKVGLAVADISGGMFAAFGIVAALFHRMRTGIGQMVDISLLDSQVAWLTYRAAAYFASGEIPQPLGSGHPAIVPYQAFKTKDAYINIAVGNERLWKKFCETVGLEDIAFDPRFSTNAKRVENREEIVRIIENLLKTQSAEKWLKMLTDAGIPCGPIYTVDKVFADPQVLHRQMLQTIDHPKAGRINVIGIPVKMSASPGAIRTAPPLLGEHTEEILNGLGYSHREIEKLKEENII